MQRTQPRSANGVPAVDEEAVSTRAVEGTPGDAVPSPASRRVNPRTGKPLTMPQPLSLSPHPMSPIVPEYGPESAGNHTIQEEHEEVRISSIYGILANESSRSFSIRMADLPSIPRRLRDLTSAQMGLPYRLDHQSPSQILQMLLFLQATSLPIPVATSPTIKAQWSVPCPFDLSRKLQMRISRRSRPNQQ